MLTKVKEFVPKDGKIPFRITLSHDGNVYTTQRAEVVSGLKIGLLIDADVESGRNDKGYDYHYFNGWKLATPEQQAEAPPDMSEARDRRIAMESAYGSATTFYAGRDIPPKELAAVARAIFRDIIAAGAGESFEPKEPKRE